MLEAQLVSMATQQLPNVQSPDILTALKAMQDGVVKETKQTNMSTVFAAPTGVPDHLTAGRK